MSAIKDIPEAATGLRLCKMVGDELVLAEEVQFPGGLASVDVTLRRAAISGQVGPVGETGDWWADIFDAKGDMIETIALDRRSWNALKNRWMRCRIENLEAAP